MILATVLLALGVAAIVFGFVEGISNKPLSLFAAVPMIVGGMILAFAMIRPLEMAMFGFDPSMVNTPSLLILTGLLVGTLAAVAGIRLRRRLLHRQCGLRIWQ